MYLTLLILPLLGALFAGLTGSKLGDKGSHIITISALIATSILSIIVYYEVVLCGSPVILSLGHWFDIGSLSVNWAFRFDQLSVSMILPVVFISMLIHIFSADYIANDPHNPRFFAYLSMFTFFMIILLTGDNYLVMFVG